MNESSAESEEGPPPGDRKEEGSPPGDRKADEPSSEVEPGRTQSSEARDRTPPSPPTPVRDMMPAGTGRPDPEDLELSAAPELSIEFESEGRTWLARSGGRTRSGTSPDRGAPLILVTFQPADDPEAEPEREAWAVALSLDELSPQQLSELFSKSKPFRKADPAGDATTPEGRESRKSRSGRRGRGR